MMPKGTWIADESRTNAATLLASLGDIEITPQIRSLLSQSGHSNIFAPIPDIKIQYGKTQPSESSNIPDSIFNWWDNDYSSYLFQPNNSKKKQQKGIDEDLDAILKASLVKARKEARLSKPLGALASESSPQIEIPEYLTLKQQKQLRRQNRKNKQEEERALIVGGFKEAPAPRITMKNYLRVLGSAAASINPTEVEALVKQEMKLRLELHYENNAEMALSPEQRAEKKANKLRENIDDFAHVTVFRIENFYPYSQKVINLIEKNANWRYMHGTLVLSPQLSILVLESGPKNTKFLRNLILKRLNWEADSEHDELRTERDLQINELPSDVSSTHTIQKPKTKRRFPVGHFSSSKPPKITVTWSGTVLQPKFQTFFIKRTTDFFQVRNILGEYFDISVFHH